MIIRVEKKNTNCREYFLTRIYTNTHEYEKIKFMKIRGSFMIIHVEKKLFMFIRVYLCSFVLKRKTRISMNYS